VGQDRTEYLVLEETTKSQKQKQQKKELLNPIKSFVEGPRLF
jgi:hypothetical protein